MPHPPRVIGFDSPASWLALTGDSGRAPVSTRTTSWVAKSRTVFGRQIRIVGRDAIVDQQVPDNRTLSSITRASTANIVSFVWGDWLYRAEVEDKGFDPEIAVQKIL